MALGGGSDHETACVSKGQGAAGWSAGPSVLRTSPFPSREQEIMDAAVAAGLSVRREAGGRELGGGVQYSHLLACITRFVRTLDSILLLTILVKRFVSEGGLCLASCCCCAVMLSY